MAVPLLSKHKLVVILILIPLALSCFCTAGSAQDIPGKEMISDALRCFSSKIFSGCDESYRLTMNGNLNVPPEATDLFCNGPCLTETQAVLHCINNVLSDFKFFNEATVRDMRSAINAGCSYTNLRGNFNVG
ncbi:uncharacterized protein LOC126674692 [Mercurialis annua]|uniref:uncharacterized protein LOC126674692 n=1 Tax=Mercurialis annua TaxID=3986 RepID=UPI00215EDC27|nr:uncharacterized protein LOC126674692 [Mercurialis annua]